MQNSVEPLEVPALDGQRAAGHTAHCLKHPGIPDAENGDRHEDTKFDHIGERGREDKKEIEVEKKLN